MEMRASVLHAACAYNKDNLCSEQLIISTCSKLADVWNNEKKKTHNEILISVVDRGSISFLPFSLYGNAYSCLSVEAAFL